MPLPNLALKAPFPWFGGKSKVAAMVWSRFGQDVKNYIEPFFGSGAMLLGRPGGAGRIETVNDKDGFVANFWRAVQADPESVAEYADWPVNENDLAARHYWLVTEGRARLAKLQGDPLGYDAQVAGWWVWGVCSWIGSGWCSGKGPWQWRDGEWVKRPLPHLGNAGQGINRQLPYLVNGQGINRKLPHLGDAGKGINRQLPYLGDAGQGRHEIISGWFAELADRLRHVRVACGDWGRVCGPSPTTKQGITAVFLDPPYSAGTGRDMSCYSVDDGSVAHDVRRWALENGDNPRFRIALCGYDTEHVMTGWAAVPWKASGGYGSQGDAAGRLNASREVVWFSPHCLSVETQECLVV